MAKQRLLPPDRYRAMTRRHLVTGVYRSVGPLRGIVDYSNDCNSPVKREIRSVMDAPITAQVAPSEPHRITDLSVRCRQCEPCLKARAALWRMRAEDEVSLAPRTWFSTFTLNPDEHNSCYYRQALRLSRQCIDICTLDDAEVFVLRHKEINKYFTKYFKRLRKAGYKFRYLLVAEAHKTGLPHYHALIHDCSVSLPLRHKTLVDQWQHGFTKFKLLEDGRAISYTTKYLMKSALARVRASAGYGQAVSLSGNAQRKDALTRNFQSENVKNVTSPKKGELVKNEERL